MGGKSSSTTIGYWYRLAYHHGIAGVPATKFLEFRAANKTAWSGELTANGIIHVNAPNLFGGEKDQGGIVGDLEIMFGEADQVPNDYLLSTFGSQVPAWQGVTTVVYRGGRYGAMNPYPQKPGYKCLFSTAGWDNGCWYPEKCEVPVAASSTLRPDAEGWQYQVIAYHDNPGYENLAIPADGWLEDGQGPFTDTGDGIWPQNTILWLRRTITVQGVNQICTVGADNGCVVFVNGAIVGTSNRDNVDIDGNQNNPVTFPMLTGQTYELAVKAFDEPPGDPHSSGTYCAISVSAPGLIGMNPAHVLYEARTAADRGAEPIESMNDASWRAAADWFYDQGIGLCQCEYNADKESVDEFIARIEKLASCSVNRDPVDGMWYLDVANGVYDLESLPILDDDDILDWDDSPRPVDEAVNSLSVQYFDPQQWVTVTTPPVQALALITDNGLIHDVHEYNEVPTGDLATRLALRDLADLITPTRALNLTTTNKPYSWRRNTYFRLQAPKKGIADMVCLLAEKSGGTLKSGAMKITVAQDIYSMPAASFVQVEPGVDTRPPQIPLGITSQAAFEAPYIDVVRKLSRADLDALPDDVGFLETVAKDPGTASRDYTITVSTDDGETYVGSAIGHWCPSAVVVEGDTLTDAAPATDFTFTGGTLLSSVAVGSAAIWEGTDADGNPALEWCRVDAIDADGGTLTLGRGCADTVPLLHAVNQRIWFYDGFAASDNVEYTDAETIDAKLLTNTGSAQLDASLATPMALTFDQRQVRPYPAAHIQINGEDYPSALTGELTVTWYRRNRLTQADQLLATGDADVGPEEGQTYTVTYFLNGVQVNQETGLTGTAATPYTYPTDGAGRIEVDTVLDGLGGWQKQVCEFTYGAPPPANFVAFPLTYDEQDYAGTMTWTRQGNGPHVTPLGFEGDGYSARYMSTTIPTWMQDADSALTLHASMSFYPQELKGTSEIGVYLGNASAFAKVTLGLAPDATNNKIPQAGVRVGITGSTFVEKVMSRSGWKYQFRTPDVTLLSQTAAPQAILFLDSDTLLLSAYSNGTTRVYKYQLSTNTVLGHFDCTGDFGHVACFAKRGNGDIWAVSATSHFSRIDVDGSLSSGSLVTLDAFEITDFTPGALEFVTVSGTEYAIVPEYLTSGAPYFYVFAAASFGSTDMASTDRYKRFTGCTLEIQGCAMRSGILHSSGISPDQTSATRYGYICTWDIVTAIGSTADGGALARIAKFDACTKYVEDCAVHPTTNDLWCQSEGISAVGSDAGGLSVWSSPLDGSLVENHYTIEYDGAGTTTIKINNQPYDALSGTAVTDVTNVAIGGPPNSTGGMTARFFTGYIRNVVFQDVPMTTAQYDAAVGGDYEPNSLTAYEFTLTNPGAEAGTTATGWTAESGGLGVLTYPASTVPPHSGSRNFSGGTSASTIARQRLDILAQTGLTGAQIDAGGIWAKVRWWQASFNSSTDPCGMGLRTLDSSDTSQGEAYAGIAWTPNANGTSYYPWYPRAFALALPSGARSLDALQKMTRTSGTNNDGWIDDISVTVYRQD